MDVVSVGGIVTDIYSFCPTFPKPGESVCARYCTMGYGGKGANQAVMAAKLGAKSALIGKVGDDVFGKMHFAGYEEAGLNSDFVFTTSEAGTALACVMVRDDGMNCISVAYQATLLLNKDDIQKAEDMIKSAKVVSCQLETTHATTLAALKVAKKHGVTTVLNAAPPSAEPLCEEMFTVSDIFCTNETETETFTGLPVATVDEAKMATKFLLGKGCKSVIVTLGEGGCVYASLEEKEPKHLPAKKVKAVNTTGAGDAFIGALCFYIAKYSHLSFGEKIRRSVEIATISVLSQGTQTSYPLAKDLPKELLE
ncbi:ribokinase-like [Lineus longissimus]|uniref:ribokinase-like n=1 Tax=Lineus longissimus TaxID=88925 RepID=UPI002B4CB546